MSESVQIAAKTSWPFFAAMMQNVRKSGRNPSRVIPGYLAAWAAFFLILVAMPPLPGLSVEAKAVLAIVVWASIMWVAEAMPVGITGISIPLLLIVTHALPWTKRGNQWEPPLSTAFSGFTNDVVWLCLFAFMVGGMMQLLKLDRRIAMSILRYFRASLVGKVVWGMYAVNVVLAFLIPAANARAAAMLPVVTGIANLLGDSPRERDAQKSIIIQALVYGSMICGMFILTAHLPNLIMVNLFASNGRSINYVQWMWLNWPYLGMLPFTSLWVKWYFNTGDQKIAGGMTRIDAMHREIGPMASSEKTCSRCSGSCLCCSF